MNTPDNSTPRVAAELLELVYQELRSLAAQKLAQEKPGHTLQATALVHEAYLRLVGPDPDRPFANRRHFLAAAAEAMRRILIDNARRKNADRRGGGRQRHDAADLPLAAPEPDVDLLTLNDALDRLAAQYPLYAEVVKLRYFAGLTITDTATALDLAPATVERYWNYSRAWLRADLDSGNS